MAYRLDLKPIGDICGKKRFHHESEARAAMEVMARREESEGHVESARHLRVYWCHRCSAYHFGHLWI